MTDNPRERLTTNCPVRMAYALDDLASELSEVVAHSTEEEALEALRRLVGDLATAKAQGVIPAGVLGAIEAAAQSLVEARVVRHRVALPAEDAFLHWVTEAAISYASRMD